VEEEEESIFISMTDIMVGLLFIFILIIMYFALQAKLDSEQISEHNITIKQQAGIIEAGEEGASARRELDKYLESVTAHRATILRWISTYLENSGIESVEIDIQAGILRLPEGVLFKSGQYIIRPDSKAAYAAKALAEALSKILPCSVMTTQGIPYRPYEQCNRGIYHNKVAGFIEAIFLEGHTDNQQIENPLRNAPLLTTNLKLSSRRATNTFEEILSLEPSLKEFYAPKSSGNKPILAVSAYGETRPISNNDTAVGRASNRRIDLRILMYEPQDTGAHEKILLEADRAEKKAN
jgi:chemotaxis protein MotB